MGRDGSAAARALLLEGVKVDGVEGAPTRALVLPALAPLEEGGEAGQHGHGHGHRQQHPEEVARRPHQQLVVEGRTGPDDKVRVGDQARARGRSARRRPGRA